MTTDGQEERVLLAGELDAGAIRSFLGRFGLDVHWVNNGGIIPGSYWGEPEAGIIRGSVYLRADTPVHSLLHETCHVICMDNRRRKNLDRDAGGDDLEESAVCYLQVVLADELPGVGRHRVMRDMDSWGYSFRLGSTGRWFNEDAEDASSWLIRYGLLMPSLEPTFRLRT